MRLTVEELRKELKVVKRYVTDPDQSLEVIALALVGILEIMEKQQERNNG